MRELEQAFGFVKDDLVQNRDGEVLSHQSGRLIRLSMWMIMILSSSVLIFLVSGLVSFVLVSSSDISLSTFISVTTLLLMIALFVYSTNRLAAIILDIKRPKIRCIEGIVAVEADPYWLYLDDKAFRISKKQCAAIKLIEGTRIKAYCLSRTKQIISLEIAE